VQEQRHSGLGIASFVTAIIAMVLMFLLVVVAGVLTHATPGGLDPKAPLTIAIGFGILLFALTALVALVLGVVGLFQRDRQKTFAVLGVLFSAATLVSTALLMRLGSSHS